MTQNTPSTIRIFPCPQCGRPSPMDHNPDRPFCSPRCRLMDLGAWVDERYRVPAEEPAEEFSNDDES
ncbi:DNA gyrase inhibitor YacG [Desulfuromonas sp. CSMB_57]|uniref:DNA gyrase inhibitor YacG n=1 Tax=Desulfuromonas sp. CSMB_57 TaxID=2807629 RepID=UPI001CD38B20|nr:DNA gyrase inhibitor YacG [Desulfuromonas sp. CSMB_57]